MRLLLINDWPRLHGGVEEYLGTLRPALADAGHEVALLTSTAGSAADGTAEFRAFGTERLAPQTVLQIANPFAVAAVRRAVRRFRPDAALVGMVEAHLSPAALLALGDVPTVLSVNNYKPICPIAVKLLPDGTPCTVPAGAVCLRGGCVGLAHWIRDRPRYALLRRAIGGVDVVVTCSEWMKRALASEGIAARVIHLPVEPPSPGYARAPSADPLLVFVGRLSREKGGALLIDAFARARTQAPGARLRIVGDGPERPELEARVASRGMAPHVVFTGWQNPAGVERELSAAWAAVVPSLWAEPLGLVAAEPLVRGVPVIAAAHGGLLDIVEPGAGGLLFAPGDEAALAARLTEVLTGTAFPGRRPDADAVARARARHSPGAHVERLVRAFDDARAGAATA